MTPAHYVSCCSWAVTRVNAQLHGLTLLTYALSKRSYECATVLLDDSRCDVNAQAHSEAYRHPLEYVLFDTHHMYNSMR